MNATHWTNVVVADEEAILTIHQNGKPDTDELGGSRYRIHFSAGRFHSFRDQQGNQYKTPTALCCAKLQRHGIKQTNQWRGPRHVLVRRGESWVPIGGA